MNGIWETLRADERISLRLRQLYDSRGFKQVQPGKFEDYSLYLENKNFLHDESIISFMDMDGKLLALKPDVTLSIVKNIPQGILPGFRKIYYVDEVYRASRENREYKTQRQIGVELVGPSDVFANIEVLDLALLSLETISADFVLDMSHLGFVSGVLAGLGLSPQAEKQLIGAIHGKNTHEMQALLREASVPEEDQRRVRQLLDIHGDIEQALPQAATLLLGPEMQEAYDQLCTVSKALSYNGFKGKINLDFSVVNDLDYYNGLIFQGYVEGIPYSVLTGGRYDNLMHKMGKVSGAIGFAISLENLHAYIRTGRRYDFDLVITYGDHPQWTDLLRTIRQLTAQGKRVRLEREGTDLAKADFTYKQHLRYVDNALVEEGGDAPC